MQIYDRAHDKALTDAKPKKRANHKAWLGDAGKGDIKAIMDGLGSNFLKGRAVIGKGGFLRARHIEKAQG